MKLEKIKKLSNTKIGIVNASLFIIVFLLTIFKKLFPTIVLPTWLTPLMEEPQEVSIASILKTTLLLIIIFVDIMYLLNNNKCKAC